MPMRYRTDRWISAGLLLWGTSLGCEPASPVVGRVDDGLGNGGQGATGSTASGSYNLFVSALDPESSCVPRALPASVETSCVIAAASVAATCDCAQPGRRRSAPGVAQLAIEELRDSGQCDAEGVPSCESFCVCEVPPVAESDVGTCRTELDATGVDGWCDVDSAAGGNPELVDCPAEYSWTHALRFLGAGVIAAGETAFLACAESTHQTDGAPAALGEPCVMNDELRADFGGFDETDVTVETANPRCDSGVCLANHFRGRASCPYGQASSDLADGTASCFLPWSDRLVEVPVRAQLEDRPAETSSVCSCRCDGPGPGPFCACPDSMECAPLIAELGFETDALYAGSYCVPRGTTVEPDPGPACVPADDLCGPSRPYPPQ